MLFVSLFVSCADLSKDERQAARADQRRVWHVRIHPLSSSRVTISYTWLCSSLTALSVCLITFPLFPRSDNDFTPVRTKVPIWYAHLSFFLFAQCSCLCVRVCVRVWTNRKRRQHSRPRTSGQSISLSSQMHLCFVCCVCSFIHDVCVYKQLVGRRRPKSLLSLYLSMCVYTHTHVRMFLHRLSFVHSFTIHFLSLINFWIHHAAHSSRTDQVSKISVACV